MNINEYQKWTLSTAVYPGAGKHGFDEATYLTLGLVSEAGEVAGKLKKIIRGDTVQPEAFLAEIGDVLWYLTRLIDNVGLTVEDVADFNHHKLEERKKLHTIMGSGDDNASRIIAPNS